MTAPKVGDVVAWADVPDGALVRQSVHEGRAPEFCFAARHGDRSYLCGVTVPLDGFSQWYRERPVSPWDRTYSPNVEPPHVTIVALHLTGQETAADLRRLAEVFEIRDHLMRTGDDAIWFGQDIDDLAPRLHAADWRPDMTAEDAARLLAEADRR